MIPNEPIIFKNFISEQEQIILKDNALQLLNDNILVPNSAGKNRYFKSFFNVEDLNEPHRFLYEKVVDTLSDDTAQIDPLLGMIISVIKPNGFIHKHKDQYFKHKEFQYLYNKRNVRFNVMVNREDDISYDPHISDKPFNVKQCDAWCFAASELEHYTPPIRGNEFRIVYQFGFCMDIV